MNVDRSEYAEVVATQKDNEEVNPNTVQYCRTGIVTDSRIRRERVCQTPNDRQATRDAFQRRLDVGGWMGGLGN